MKKSISKTEAKEKIEKFFEREDFNSEEVRKIKRLAMKYNIKLGKNRKSFCRKCLSKLTGKIKVDRNYKTVICGSCGFKNRFRISTE